MEHRCRAVAGCHGLARRKAGAVYGRWTRWRWAWGQTLRTAPEPDRRRPIRAASGRLEIDRWYRILEQLQLVDDRPRNDVGTNGEDLTQLDEGGTEPADVSPSRKRRVGCRSLLGCEPGEGDEVSEPVSDEHRGDLRNRPRSRMSI